ALSGGGGGGGAAFPERDLEKRISALLASHLSSYAFRWRMLGLLFGQPSTKTFTEQIAPRLEYWHHRSGERFDFLCVGYSHAQGAFNPELFAESVRWLQDRSAWRYSGLTDLVLLNASVERPSRELRLHANQVVAVALESAVDDGAIPSVPGFIESIVTFAEEYHGDDPTWGFSDSEAQRLGASGLKAVLVSCLPKALRKDASAAFHLRVREHAEPAA
ncbi:MAG TPA: hypothetical protein VHV78_01600, partial [Gemmatimonadaceae bacterium]|nr:hypothetical protein [Gemmatimonadaceae bacterium]